MNRTIKKVIIPLVVFGLLASSLSMYPFTPRSVRAQFTGLVCISSSTSSCAASPPTFSGSIGNKITVNVVIQGSDSFNSFDISVQADPSVISPTGISTTGTVFSGHQIVALANSTNQATGVARLAVAVVGFTTPSPTTGLLFSINYNIVGASTGTPISYPTGCSSSSVAGTTDCVQVVNPGTGVDPETVQGATFVTTPGFTVSASASSLSIQRGSSGSLTITVTGTGGFTGTVSLSAIVSPSIKHGPLATQNPSSIMLSSGNTSGTSVSTVSALHSTPIGTYTVTITGSSGSISHSVTIGVTVSA